MNNNSNFLVINQAIVDTSLEIKSPLEIFQKMSTPENISKITIKISVDDPEIKDISHNQDGSENKEIKIRYFITGIFEEKPLFIIEVVHSGLIKCINVTEEQKEYFFKKEYLISITPYLYCAATDVLKSAGLNGIFIPPVELINFEQATVIKHYAKDISFQINCPIRVLAEIKQDHQEKRNANINFSIQSKTKPINLELKDDQKLEILELEISSSIVANYQNKPLCTCEILYSIIVTINKMEKEFKQQFLSFDCPRLFFPFIIALTNKSFMDAGLGKINIPPIDFNRIVLQQKTKANE